MSEISSIDTGLKLDKLIKFTFVCVSAQAAEAMLIVIVVTYFFFWGGGNSQSNADLKILIAKYLVKDTTPC